MEGKLKEASNDECRSLLGEARPHSEGSPQSRSPPSPWYGISGSLLLILILGLCAAHLFLPHEHRGLRHHAAVRPVHLDGLSEKDEEKVTTKEDLVVGVDRGRNTVVTENCVWNSCGENTVCRLSALDGTDDGNRTANVTSSHSLKACKQLCESRGEDACKGVEFNARTGRCELWSQPILSHRSCITGEHCPEANYSCHTMQCKAIDEQVTLHSSERSFKDRFGRSVSISGDTVAVGASGDNDRGDFSGAVYVFQRKADNFVEQAKLTANDGFRDSYFGADVSIFGDAILIGADRDGLNGKKDSGSAYVFRRNVDVWEQEAKLTVEDGVAHERFGARVSMMGHRALITSLGDAEKNVSAAAYIFHYTKGSWVLQQQLQVPKLKPHAHFGASLSQTEDTIMIGASKDDFRGPSSGSVTVYTFNGTHWSLPAKLVAKGTKAGDHFGCSVGMSDGLAIIGAYGHSTKWKGGGAAYIFKRERGKWVEQVELLPEDGDANDGFGRSVSLSANTAAIGASGDEHDGVDKSGSGYIFVRQGQKWVQQTKVAPSKAEAGARFGQAASISGHMATFSTASEQAFVFPASLSQVCRH